MSTRRQFLGWTTAALGGSALSVPASADGPAKTPAHRPTPGRTSARCSRSSRARRSRGTSRSRSCASSSRDPAAWKRQARGKLLELLHYAAGPCDPRPEVVERVDRGDHVREKVYFNTTPDVRVPAYVLVPKKAGRRCRPSSPCTTTAGSTSGARRSWSRPTTSTRR